MRALGVACEVFVRVSKRGFVPLSAFVLPSLLAFGFASALAALMLLLGGKERGHRVAGLAVSAGFLAGWAATWKAGWFSDVFADSSSFLVLGAIVFGGGLLGLILDVCASKGRMFRIAAIFLFSLACVWISLDAPTALPGKDVLRIELLIGAGIMMVFWLIVLLRLETYVAPNHGFEGAAVIVPSACGLAALALIADAPSLSVPALALAAASAGFAPLAWAWAASLSASGVFGGGGALMGLAVCLGSLRPGTILPLTFLSLCLFAGPTARRLPGAAALRPLWAALLGFLPVGLACLLAFSLLDGS